MLDGWVVVAVALGYIGLLFVIASYGDRLRQPGRSGRMRLMIYPLSLAIYCTSWTFFGSVGLASRTGYDFLTIYIGPILMIGLGWPLLTRIVRLAKNQNITSIADFIAARYGKDQNVATAVALIAIVGTIPYIALQLKAVSSSLGTILVDITAKTGFEQHALGDIAPIVALLMAIFAVLFGTRHIDATEHQDGLMLAIATESIVKLVAFLAVGAFVTFWLFDGPTDLFTRALKNETTAALLTTGPHFSTFAAMTLLSTFAIVLLPRQFHVGVVENNNEDEIKRVAWLFPLYLVLINLFVLPIALAGLMTFPRGDINSDMFVLALPLSDGSNALALIAFIGGLSAATAMVIVESVALSIMVSNDIVVPWVLQRRERFISGREHVGGLLLVVRRSAIFFILLLAYLYYRNAGEAQLAQIGLLSFAAIAQLAPAFFGGLIWRRGTALGAIAGLTVGITAWAYTLLLPSIADVGIIGRQLISDGPWGIDWLRPQALFGLSLEPLVHGVVWSLTLNILAFVGFSLLRNPTPIERLQSDLFVPQRLAPTPSFLWRSSATVGELMATVARYLGEDRTRTALQSFAAERRISLDPKADADFQLLRYAEHLLASAIGAASSRLVLSMLLRKRTMSTKAALKALDDANAAIHYNREILQTALDHVRQGIAVYNKDFQLICWNRQFGELLDLPPELTRVGTSVDEILRSHAERGAFGSGPLDTLVRAHLDRHAAGSEPFRARFAERGIVVEIRTNRMPDGGTVMTVTDITASVAAAEALERANATLELRVRQRTTELTRLNAELASAKADAEEANISKTRFLAAASHDILQPLNAARLYVTSLTERHGSSEDAHLIANIDASLEGVEEIIGALLDISRLDSGVMKPEFATFRMDELFRQLEVEFTPLAREKGLSLKFMPCSLHARSDRRLLRRLLENLVSNAIKYTPKGRVLVGCRRNGGNLRIEVHDTGLGIPASKKQSIFREFHRLDDGAKVARGLGLGLSIVERIARVLDHEIQIDSEVDIGSCFSVIVPVSGAQATRAAVPKRIKVNRGQLPPLVVLCIDNEPKVLDGMQVLLSGWGCHVLKAPDLAAAIALVAEAQVPLNGLLVDYHLDDDNNGIKAIAELRRRFGSDLPAILITADRNPDVRAAARAGNIQVLHKPIKPASLRALLAQWQVQRAAAAE
jgi:Na+/proline symporter/signal transduction histidine kinase/CheY-like chemotaxis protein